MTNKTPGYYVEGMHFGIRHAQAMARAKHLANLYGRAVDVCDVDPAGNSHVFVTVHGSKPRRSAPTRHDWSPFLRAAVGVVEDMP